MNIAADVRFSKSSGQHSNKPEVLAHPDYVRRLYARHNLRLAEYERKLQARQVVAHAGQFLSRVARQRTPRRAHVSRIARRVSTTASSDDPAGPCSDSDGPSNSYLIHIAEHCTRSGATNA